MRTLDDPSSHSGLRHRIKKRPLIALGLATVASLIIGGALGWALGSRITCGPQCEADPDMIGAIGTWIGALGTTGALIFTAREITASQRRKKTEDNLLADKILTEARDVSCTTPKQTVSDMGSAEYTGEPILLLNMHNFSDYPITNIRVLNRLASDEIFQTSRIKKKDPNGNPTTQKFSIPLSSNNLFTERVRRSVGEIAELEKEYYKLRKEKEQGSEIEEWIEEWMQEHISNQTRKNYSEAISKIKQKIELHGPKMEALEKQIVELKEEIVNPLERITCVEFTMEGHRFQWDSNTREVELIAQPHS